MTISPDEGMFMLADWLKELERRGWHWEQCPNCGEYMIISPDGTVAACAECDPDLWLSKIAEYYPNEGAKA